MTAGRTTWVTVFLAEAPLRLALLLLCERSAVARRELERLAEVFPLLLDPRAREVLPPLLEGRARDVFPPLLEARARDVFPPLLEDFAARLPDERCPLLFDEPVLLLLEERVPPLLDERARDWRVPPLFPPELLFEVERPELEPLLLPDFELELRVERPLPEERDVPDEREDRAERDEPDEPEERESLEEPFASGDA